MLFSKLNRKKVKADNPGRLQLSRPPEMIFRLCVFRTDISFGGIGKKLGEMWREMAEDEKEKYNKPENFADELEAEDD